ncbi:non-specific lipid transfer protein GPI-anchored 14-like isoform X3 [Henckelia pumila]|uniref:non-specific lipid transfer protein GPI-anchored 14-like isoform X3 n=1 Tax=Henckelia pumila TaxID=405737 RepID=UPI003C6E9765
MRTWILWVLFLRVAASDVDKDKDKEECANQLVTDQLAKCLPYVSGGEDKSPPTRDCCTGVDQVVHKNLRCICLLVRDHRNDLKINATLALSLPELCQVPANVSDCSPDAKLFDDFANNGSMAARARPRIGSSNNGTGSNSVPGSGHGGILRPEIGLWLSLTVAAAAAAMVDH